MRFNGSDYDPKFDDARLTEQHLRILKIMSDVSWRTLREISDLSTDPESSISAQLRHLRKERFGSYVVEKRSRSSRVNGLFEYRLLPPGSDSQYDAPKRKNKFREALVAIWKHPDTTEEQRMIITEIVNKKDRK